MDEQEPQDIQDEPWFDTRKRIITAVVGLVVVAVLLGVINQAIKTHKSTHESYGGITKLDIKVGNSSLKFVSTAGDAIDVTRKVDYTLRGPSLTQKVQGDSLVIRQNCSGIHVGECSTSYTIALPKSVVTNIVSSGGSVMGSQLQGPFTARTSGGKIQLVEMFGDLNLTTDSGQIAAKDLSSLNVVAKSKGGKIETAFSVSPTKVDVNSIDGSILVTVPKGNAAYNVNAGSSNAKSTVDVKNDANSPRSISARSVNGKVSVQN